MAADAAFGAAALVAALVLWALVPLAGAITLFARRQI
jgi:hypothetical protein